MWAGKKRASTLLLGLYFRTNFLTNNLPALLAPSQNIIRTRGAGMSGSVTVTRALHLPVATIIVPHEILHPTAASAKPGVAKFA